MSMFETRYGRFYLGDARKLIRNIPDESVDVIITDPPYGLGTDEYDDANVFFEIEDELYRVLKPDGFLVFFYSIKHLDRAVKNMKRFRYVWIMVAITSRGNVRSTLGINSYTPVLVYAKGKPKPVFRGVDVLYATDEIPVIDKWAHKTILSNGNAGRQFKSTLVTTGLLRRFTRRGDLVLDPFAGYGSIPLTCEVFGRRWIAFEIDPQKYVLAGELLKKLLGQR